MLSSQCAQLGLSVALQLGAARRAGAGHLTLTRRLVEALLGYAVHGDQREEVVGRILQMDAAHQALMLRIEQQLATPRAAGGSAAPGERRRPLPRSVSPSAAFAGPELHSRAWWASCRRAGGGARARETLEVENDRLRAARDALSGELRGKVEEVQLRFRAATAEAEAAEGLTPARRRALRREPRRATPSCASWATAEPAAAAAAAALGERRLRRRRLPSCACARCAQARGAGAGASSASSRWKVRCRRQDLEIEALRERAVTARKAAAAAARRRRGGGGRRRRRAGGPPQQPRLPPPPPPPPRRQPAPTRRRRPPARRAGAAAVQAAAAAARRAAARRWRRSGEIEAPDRLLRLAGKLLAQQRGLEQLRARVASDAPPTSNEVQILHETLGQRDQELKALIAMKEEGEAQLRDEQRLVATAFYELSLECARLRGE